MPISDQTTNLSNLSVDGTIAASRLSSGQTAIVNALWASSISQGGQQFTGGFSVTSFRVAAQVVQGSASSFTVSATVTTVKKGDILIANPFGGAGVSSISSGLVWTSHATQDGQFEFRYSNVSTLEQAQSAQTFNLAIIRL